MTRDVLIYQETLFELCVQLLCGKWSRGIWKSVCDKYNCSKLCFLSR